jgi:O-antigen/teichoic acid export membrane protein
MWLTLEKLTQQGMWLLLFLILAPILGPKPYGMFTIVMAFIGFCETVIVGATSESLVTIPDIDDKHLQTANLATLAIAAIASAMAFASSNLLADFFETAELGPLFRALSPLPVISALTATPIAVLSRSMRFRPLAVRSIVGLLVGGIVAVGLALNGAGVWALVAQILVQRGVELALLWSTADTRLGFQWSQPHFRDLQGYAASVGISKAMAWSGGQIPRIILGWYLGPADLGLFALAARLVDFVTQVFVVPQAWVARLSLREFANEPTKFAEAFQLTIRQIAFLAFPVCCGLAAIIPSLFAAFLDERWTPGALAAQILVLTGIPAVFYYCFTAAVLAARRPHLDSQIAVATDSTTALAVLVAGPHGLYVACGAMLAQRLLMMPAPLLMLRRVANISPIGVIFTQLPILGAATAMGILVYFIAPLTLATLPRIIALVTLVVIGGVVYAPLALIAARDVATALYHRVLSAARPRAEPI